MNRLCFQMLLAPFIVASVINMAHADALQSSPYRLSPAGVESRPLAPAGYESDERYRLLRPDDRRPYARQIAIAARESGLDPELVHAVVAIESGYHAAAISAKGAIGLMQLMPETAQLHGVSNLADASENLRAGTRQLRELMDLFDNRLELALAAYNAGAGAVRRYNNSIPPYAETRHYVPAVVAKYRASRPIPPDGVQVKPTAHNYLPGTRLHPGSP